MTHENSSRDGSQPDSGITRRGFLTIAGLSSAALLWGCQEPNKNTGLVTSLPDPHGYHPYVPSGPVLPPPPPPVPPAPVQDTYGIIPRSVWAKSGPDMKRVDRMNGVSLITFHHSGDPKPFVTNDYRETAQHLEYVREYHRSRNFQDIGYHFAIDRAGRVWQLRSLLYQGQHVRTANEHNIGVVVLGNFDLQAPSQAQKDKIKQFGMLLRRQYKLAISRVKTHQEIVKTECPGDAMQPYMLQVRKQGLI